MIKVLVVDDSAIVRQVLQEELSRFPDIDVVGTAVDPFVARDKILRLKPDVLTMDIEMPRMDGLSFLKKLMQYHPLPVVMVSSLAPANSAKALEALNIGAVEVICKPDSPHNADQVSLQVVEAIRAAAQARIRKHREITREFQQLKPLPPPPLNNGHSCRLIAIGASTGGTVAIEKVLSGLPADMPGILIVQHMPEYFTGTFAERLNQTVALEVREARDNDWVAPGTVLIAPGNRHMLVIKTGKRYRVRIKNGPPVHHQRPSVDVLFSSIAKKACSDVMGVILTGMGADGAAGLLAMRQKGAYTIGQDEQTSVIYGMPKEARQMGAVADEAPLHNIAGRLIGKVNGKG